MPRSQLEDALVAELGSDWRSKMAEFDYEPLAAASIGQVHAATLFDGRKVAMKIQCALSLTRKIYALFIFLKCLVRKS